MPPSTTSSTDQCPKLSAPIVLAHGLLGFSRVQFAGMTLASYFNRIPEFLSAVGNRVLQPAVPPTGSIRRRGQALKDEIRRLVGSERVHVIAHSMGGLDARWMITALDMSEQVVSLTTLGTPHRGTVFADRSVGFASRWRLFGGLRTLGIPDEAFFDLRTDRTQTFNVTTPDVPEVRYFSVAGEPSREAMLPVLRFSYDLIADVEGPNDGLVSVTSATWGESIDVWNADHVNMVGWTLPWQKVVGQAFEVEAAYRGILERLAGLEGR